eukprot:5265-Heterococcus_DN1.PRE.5
MMWVKLKCNSVQLIDHGETRRYIRCSTRDTFETLPHTRLRDWATRAIVPLNEHTFNYRLVYAEREDEQLVRFDAPMKNTALHKHLALSMRGDIKAQLKEYLTDDPHDRSWSVTKKWVHCDWCVTDEQGVEIDEMSSYDVTVKYRAVPVYKPESLAALSLNKVNDEWYHVKSTLHTLSDDVLQQLARACPQVTTQARTSSVPVDVAVRLVQNGWPLPKGEDLLRMRRCAFEAGQTDVFGACFDCVNDAERAAKRLCTLRRQLN